MISNQIYYLSAISSSRRIDDGMRRLSDQQEGRELRMVREGRGLGGSPPIPSASSLFGIISKKWRLTEGAGSWMEDSDDCERDTGPWFKSPPGYNFFC